MVNFIMIYFLTGIVYVLINGIIRKLYDNQNDPLLAIAHLLLSWLFLIGLLIVKLQELFENEKFIAFVKRIASRKIV